jgi:hypothetical protein
MECDSDVPRRQITFDAVEVDSGQVCEDPGQRPTG